MKESTAVLILTLAGGVPGFYLGAALNMGGYLGVIAAVAVAAFFIVRAAGKRCIFLSREMP